MSRHGDVDRDINQKETNSIIKNLQSGLYVVFHKSKHLMHSIYIHALVIIGILTAITYLTYLIFITLKLWISKIKKNRTCVEPITPHSIKLREKGNSRPQEIVITVTSPSVQDFNQNTEVNDYNKTTQPKNCQINSNHLHSEEKLGKEPSFQNSTFRELDVVKLSDLGGIHILRRQSYVNYDGNPLKF